MNNNHNDLAYDDMTQEERWRIEDKLRGKRPTVCDGGETKIDKFAGSTLTKRDPSLGGSQYHYYQ
jgi:hypothetical protein